MSRRAAIKYNGLVAISVAVPTWLSEREADAGAPKQSHAWEARAKELEAPMYTAAAPGKCPAQLALLLGLGLFEAHQHLEGLRYLLECLAR